MAFPNDALEIKVELELGGEWTDVTSDVRTSDSIDITYGRADESATVDPGKCTFKLNNRAGKYSPRNPLSEYYGKLGRNTPVRVSLPNMGESTPGYLLMDGDDASGVATPDSAALDLTGDLDIRIDMDRDTLDAPPGGLFGKWIPSTSNRSWWIGKATGRVIHFYQGTVDGSGSIVEVGFDLSEVELPQRFSLLVALDINNGASGYTTALYWGPSIDGPWTLVDVQSGTPAMPDTYASTAPVRIGQRYDTVNFPEEGVFTGKTYRYQVRNGLEGTVVADADFTALPTGTTSFTDAYGNTWTLEGTAQVVGPEDNGLVRFHGEVSTWPTAWDPSGNDSWVSVEAGGIMRRLGQGTKAAESPIRRKIRGAASLVAYWPMEDQQASADQKIFTPTPGAQSMRTSGFSFASDSDLPGSAPVPTVETGATLRAAVPAAPVGEWWVEFFYKVDSVPSANFTLLWIHALGATPWPIYEVRLSTTSERIQLIGKDSEGDNPEALVDHDDATASLYGGWRRVNFGAKARGTLVDHWLSCEPAGSPVFRTKSSDTGKPGRVRELRNTFTDNCSIGHIAVYRDDPLPWTGSTAFYGEKVGDRLARLADEGSVPLKLTGDSSRTPRLGDQPNASMLDAMGDAAAVDGGILGEQRDALGLLYRTRRTLYNQEPVLTLDYAHKGDVPPGLEPVDDDQATRNDVTITRDGGGFHRIVREDGPLSVQAPPLGVGTYDESTALNLYSDEHCADQASWRVHLGTWDEARFPTVELNLAAGPHLIEDYTALNLLDTLRITNPPQWLPPGDIDLMLQGYNESLSVHRWTATLNCSPAGPWNVAVSGADHVDTEGSQLNSSATSSTTSLSVATTSGPRWTTNAGDLPLTIEVGGEVMTVTAVSGTSSPQTFTVTRGVNGISKAHASGTAVTLKPAPVIAL